MRIHNGAISQSEIAAAAERPVTENPRIAAPARICTTPRAVWHHAATPGVAANRQPALIEMGLRARTDVNGHVAGGASTRAWIGPTAGWIVSESVQEHPSSDDLRQRATGGLATIPNFEQQVLSTDASSTRLDAVHTNQSMGFRLLKSAKLFKDPALAPVLGLPQIQREVGPPAPPEALSRKSRPGWPFSLFHLLSPDGAFPPTRGALPSRIEMAARTATKRQTATGWRRSDVDRAADSHTDTDQLLNVDDILGTSLRAYEAAHHPAGHRAVVLQ